MPTETPPASQTAPPTVARLGHDAFLGLEAAWDELNLATALPLPFLTHAWLRTWWRHFGEGQQLLALAVREGPRLVAAAPLALRRQGFAGVTVRVAELLGTGPVPTRGMGLADKADLLTRADRPAAAAALAEVVAQLPGEVDAVQLRGCDSESPSLDLLAAAVPADARAGDFPRSQSPYLALPATWQDYLAGRSGNFRRKLRKYRRNLERQGKLVIRRLEPGDDPGPWMDAVRQVDTVSWKAERGTNLFRHPALSAFVADVVQAMAPRGQIDLHRLDLDDRPVAYELCFELAGRLFSYNSGYRQDHARFAPGVLLTTAVLEAACARGVTEYDLLRGDESYKSDWSPTARREREWLAVHRGPRGAAHWRAVHLKRRLKRSARLSDWADRLSGLLGRLRHQRTEGPRTEGTD